MEAELYEVLTSHYSGNPRICLRPWISYFLNNRTLVRTNSFLPTHSQFLDITLTPIKLKYIIFVRQNYIITNKLTFIYSKSLLGI
jgi:hypothetical protein